MHETRVRVRSAVCIARLALPGSLFVGVFAAVGSTSAAADSPPNARLPAAVFAALPAASAVTLSPDGKRIARINNAAPKPRVEIFDLDAHKALRAIAPPEQLIPQRLAWSDDDTLVITFSTTKKDAAAETVREYLINLAYDAQAGDGRMLPTANGSAYGAEAAALATLVKVRTSKPHMVIMRSHAACNGASCLLEVDTKTGDATLLKAGSVHTAAWVLDRAGAPLAREDWDSINRAYHLYALSGNTIREILRRDDAEPPSLGGVLPDDSALVLLSANGRPHQVAWALPLEGSPMRILAEDAQADVTDTYVDPHTGGIIGLYIGGSDTSVRWLDPKAQLRYDVVKRAFPDKQVSIEDWSADGARILAKVQSPSAPPFYYLLDLNTHHAENAGEEYPALKSTPLGEFREITYQARDGTAIPAYLTLPPGGRAGPGPLVVLPHGGPNARDYPTFNWLVQFLATRGYAVLQPQFRGSTGFGDAFEKAGYRQWGRLMQDDLTDGVRAMIDQRIADPHHVCIVGISYGGYAALAGAAFTPAVYSCAASVNGVADLPVLVRSRAPAYGAVGFFPLRYRSAAQSLWNERVGSETDPALGTESPINSAASITIPMLIAYNAGGMANEQSLPMVKVLKKARKAVEVVELPIEAPWLSQPETRTQLLLALESFLQQHLQER